MGKITKLTPEQTARFGEWTKKWVDIGLSTEQADFDAATEAALRAYALCNLKKPMVVLRMGSPYAATVGGAMAWMMLRNMRPDQVRDQVRDQVWDQVWDQVGAQVRAQVWDQVRDQVWDQVRDQVWDQVGAQVWDQVRAQVRAQVWDQVRDQVRDQVGAQVWDQVRAQVRAQVWDQVRAQVRAQVWAQVWDQVCGAAKEGLYNEGASNIVWAGYAAWVSFFRDVAGWRDSSLAKFEIAEALVKSCGWTWWHQNVLAISDRPRVINRDERGRLHCENGPSIAYRDGWALHHVHGVLVPADIIEQPNSITVARIDGEKNSEVRRVMIDRYGPAKYVQDSGATVVHQLPEDHADIGLRTARLLRKEVPDDEPIIYADLLNSTPEPDGTVKRYMLRVDPNAYGGEAARNVHAAAASTWRNADGSLAFKRWNDYRPGAES